MTQEKILLELNIDENDILNIYPYGSRVYGTQREDSDYDYTIVYKSSMLPDGSFKSNAISNKDKSIQAVCYSRGGFIDAINNYYLPAIESLSTEPVKYKFPFKLNKYNEKEMVKRVITQASNSWFNADKLWNLRNEPGILDRIKKGVWHSIRILKFGLQIKESKKITDLSDANCDLDHILNDKRFSPRRYIMYRDKLMDDLRTNK